jgi:hypothetical protein
MAEAVWRSAASAPYVVTVGPSGGLNKGTGEDDYAYHRRLVYSLNEAKFFVQVDGVEIVAGSNKTMIPFPKVENDSLFTSELAETLHFRNISLPADADSLAFIVLLNGKDTGQLRQDARMPMQAAFTLKTAAASQVQVSLGAIPAEGETKRNMRVVMPMQAFRNQAISLQLVLTNLDTDKSQGALNHVYETDSRGAGKQGTPAGVTAPLMPQQLSLQVHPNPFNPTTAIHFTLPEESIVSIRIYDVNGRLVKEWLNERRAAGEHRIQWDGRDQYGRSVASGIYFSELRYGAARRVVRMALLR